jgi:proteasome lid subunit RPN8/RPN11
MITLPSELEKSIRIHGEKGFPNEICGIILGVIDDHDSKHAEKLIAIENSFDADEQFHRFQIESEDVLRAERQAAKLDLDVIGFYHSHPEHPSEPSEFDKDHALPFYSYIIIAIEDGKSAKLTSWELSNDRTVFNEERIENRD